MVLDRDRESVSSYSQGKTLAEHRSVGNSSIIQNSVYLEKYRLLKLGNFISELETFETILWLWLELNFRMFSLFLVVKKQLFKEILDSYVFQGGCSV